MRRWADEDLAPFAAINANRVVMEHFPSTLNFERSAAAVSRIEALFDARGFGLWAVELPGEAPFIGFVGLLPAPEEMAFSPAVEIGWRLAPAFWGRGLATEAARAAIWFAFEKAGIEELVSFTATTNVRSMRVMERLGMTREAADDFEHPGIAAGHRLRPHVLYRIERERWREQAVDFDRPRSV
jgi:ribosomal-protein-alanine N-acetyltransferase